LPQWYPTQPSLSGSLTLPVNGINHEYDAVRTYNANYATSLALTNKWVNYVHTKLTHLFQTRMSYEFGRQLPTAGFENTPNAGVTTDHLTANMDYYLGSFATFQSTSGYNLLWLPQNVDKDWHQQLDPFSLSGRTSLASNLSFTFQGLYDYTKSRVTSGNVAANTSGGAWNLSINTNYSYREGYFLGPNAYFSTVNAGYNFGIGLSLQTALQYDFSAQQLSRLSLNLSRDLHCWSINAGFTQYADGKNELGFGINLKAFPEVHVGTGGAEGLSLGQSQ
jgi:hypothetical protein